MRIRDLFLEKHPEKLARDNPFKGTRPFTGSESARLEEKASDKKISSYGATYLNKNQRL